MGYAQQYDFTGYVKYAPLLVKNDMLNNQVKNVHIVYNRMNFKWYLLENLTTGFELRHDYQYGTSSVKNFYGMNPFEPTETFFKLKKKWISNNNELLESEFNRLWLDYTIQKFQLIIGRQRMSWGQSWVWNPTDVFNPVSAISLDAEEKPGTDAARLIWYFGDLSNVEIAVSPNHKKENQTAMMMIKTNFNSYDYQLLGGWNKNQPIIGGGWSGQIVDGGFRGEWLYRFKRKNNLESAEKLFVADNRENLTIVVSGDYQFENSLYLHTEIMTNKNGVADSTIIYSLQSQLNGNLSAAKTSIFTEISYDMTPLVKARLFTIVNPNDQSFLVAPSISWSVAQNLDFDSTFYQSVGSTISEFGNIGTLFLARLKWSF